jgi:murein DD-endopeptidase MepM/ murein hydrolase activator NlpD
MKKIPLSLLIILLLSLLVGFSFNFFRWRRFICPIKYENEIIVRCDSHGEGFFAASRRGYRLHSGVDLSAEVGTPVLASSKGLVIAARRNYGMGNYVIIKHRDNISTVYGHLSQIFVKKGQVVRQGKIIGTVGKTGNARFRDIQPHLHFEVRKNGIPQDPFDYIEEIKTRNSKVITTSFN